MPRNQIQVEAARRGLDNEGKCFLGTQTSWGVEGSSYSDFYSFHGIFCFVSMLSEAYPCPIELKENMESVPGRLREKPSGLGNINMTGLRYSRSPGVVQP